MNSSYQPTEPSSTQATAVRFQSHQIVYLELRETRLYAEVVQMIEKKQVCWVRPLGLWTIQPTNEEKNLEIPLQKMHDLRQGSDLLLPTALFQPALDTDVVPFMMELYAVNPLTEETELSANTLQINQIQHQQLRQFVKEICATYPETFSKA
jgi:hypothetical protein